MTPHHAENEVAPDIGRTLEPPVANLPPAAVGREVSRLDLQSAFGNSLLMAAMSSNVPPDDLSNTLALRPGIGNAAVLQHLIQRKANDNSADPASSASSETATNEAAGGSGPNPASPRLILDDSAETVQPEQMRKTAFLGQLRAGVNRAVAQVAGAPLSTAITAEIDRRFDRAGAQDGRQLEQTIRNQVSETARATTAADLMSPIAARVQREVEQQMPSGSGVLGAIGSAAASAASGVAAAVSRAAGIEGDAGSAPSTLLFKSRNGGERETQQDPETIQSQLGAGHSLDGGVQSRMESAFGASFGDVQVHTDTSDAALSERLNARAFTVGQHIAFSAGEYQPGTLIGDALIAHELAHVMQQRGAESSIDSKLEESQYSELENEADAVAVGAMVSTWEGRKGGLAQVSARLLPSLKSGLRLQRCDPSNVRPLPRLIPPEEMNSRGFYLHLPHGEPTVGRRYELSYSSPRTMPAGGFSGGAWYARRPGATEFGRREAYGLSSSWTLDTAGEWTFEVEIPLAPNEFGYFEHTITVRDMTTVASEHLGRVEPRSLEGFRERIAIQNLGNVHMATAEQPSPSGYISLTGENPSHGHGFPFPTNRYTVHPPARTTPARYQWIAVPQNWDNYHFQNHFGHERRTINGRDGYDLGTGVTAFWTLGSESGDLAIYCTMYDAQGAVAAQAAYYQAVLTEEEDRHATQFREYMNQALVHAQTLRPESAVQVAAVHVTTETGAVNELSLYLGNPVTGSGLRLIDLTPGVAVNNYQGTNFAEVIARFNDGNSYPEGQIRLRVPENNLGVTPNRWTLHTSGASFAQRLSTGWGWASLGLAVVGAVASVVAPPLAPVFFIASATLGAASAGASLYQRSQEAHPSGLGIAIDVASLAGSLLGLAGAANILRHGPRIAAVGRTARFVLYTEFATNTVAGVFIAAESAEQIAAILEGHASPEEKATAVARILSGLLLNGTLLAWGARDFAATRSRITGLLEQSVASRLSTADIHALSVLEGPAMTRLAGSSLDEVQTIAALIRENPQQALALVDQYGERFVVGARSHPGNLEELAQALHFGAPEAAGTRGSYGPRPAPGTGYRPVYVEGQGHSSPSGLARRIRDTLGNPLSPYGRTPLANGGRLRLPAAPEGATGPRTQYELVIPASGTRAEIVIPVRIESTSTRPTSVHGAETGPARMEVRTSVDAHGATHYEASIEVHQDLHTGDVPLAVGHELDELSLIAVRGVSGAEITAQQRTSLLQSHAAAPGAHPPAASDHDIATAREFARASRDVPIRPDSFDVPDDLVSRALSMGFGGPEFLDAKLQLLQDQGVSTELLYRLRLMAMRGEVAGALGRAPAVATTSVIDHLVTGGAGSSTSPIRGLHLESAVAPYLARNPRVHLVPTADSPHPVGRVTYYAYEQWRWTGPGNPPPGSQPTSPAGVAGARHGDWVLAPEPKTTVNNMPAFLQIAETEWQAWSTANRPGPGANQEWTSAVGGQAVGGFFAIDATGAVTHTTVFPRRAGGLSSW